jgi:hypothetical protein
VLNWSISRNHKEIWNSIKISVTPGMYLAQRGSVQRPLTSGSGGGRPAKSHGRSANFFVGLARGFLDTCLREKGKTMAVEKVGGGRTHWPSSHVVRSANRHLGSYHLIQVGGAPPWPYKYPPPLPMKVDTHTTFWRFHLQSSHS